MCCPKTQGENRGLSSAERLQKLPGCDTTATADEAKRRLCTHRNSALGRALGQAPRLRPAPPTAAHSPARCLAEHNGSSSAGEQPAGRGGSAPPPSLPLSPQGGRRRPHRLQSETPRLLQPLSGGEGRPLGSSGNLASVHELAEALKCVRGEAPLPTARPSTRFFHTCKRISPAAGSPFSHPPPADSSSLLRLQPLRLPFSPPRSIFARRISFCPLPRGDSPAPFFPSDLGISSTEVAEVLPPLRSSRDVPPPCLLSSPLPAVNPFFPTQVSHPFLPPSPFLFPSLRRLHRSSFHLGNTSGHVRGLEVVLAAATALIRLKGASRPKPIPSFFGPRLLVLRPFLWAPRLPPTALSEKGGGSVFAPLLR